MLELFFRGLQVGALQELLAARKHGHQVGDRTHLFEHAHLFLEIFQGKLVLAQLLFQNLSLPLVIDLFGLLDQRQHVPHAQDARGCPVGVKGFERVEFLTYANEEDRLPSDRTERQRRSPTGIPLDLGQDCAVKPKPGVEPGGDVDRFLAGHGIGTRSPGCFSSFAATCGASGISFPMTRWIFSSCCIRLACVCKRPAVSMMATSHA